MNISYDCLPCLMKQVIKVAEMYTNDEELQHKIITKACKDFSNMTFKETAPEIGRKINLYANEVIGDKDPYKELKDKSNDLAFQLIEEFGIKDVIKNSDDPLKTAIKLSVAGNIIDFSAIHDLKEGQVRSVISNCINENLYGISIEDFKRKIECSKEILFLGDNAGEIVFDKLLIDVLPKHKITYVVKGKPIVNDAIMKDAMDVHMTELVPVIDNGSDGQGTILRLCSDKFIERFKKADLIIAKGQANYETLSHIYDKEIIFLFNIKCKRIAQSAKHNVGELVMISSHIQE